MMSFSDLFPDLAVIAGTLGLCFIFVELNRPGRVVPAALGLLLALFATASLLHSGVRWWAAGMLVGSAIALLFNLWRRLHIFVLAAATVAGICGLRLLILPGPAGKVHLATAILCGGFLGVLSGILTRIAYRARRSKALD